MPPNPASPATGESPLTGDVPLVVMDTNIVLDWLLFDDPAVAVLAACVTAGRLRWRATRSMRDELTHVLGRGLAAARGADAAPLLERWDAHAALDAAPSAPHRLRCSDVSDQKFIDLAFAVGARWLFSRDRALLDLARRAAPLGLAIVPAAAWEGHHTLTTPRM